MKQCVRFCPKYRDRYNLDSESKSRALDIPMLKDDKPPSILYHLDIFRSEATLGNFGQPCDKSFRVNLPNKHLDVMGLSRSIPSELGMMNAANANEKLVALMKISCACYAHARDNCSCNDKYPIGLRYVAMKNL